MTVVEAKGLTVAYKGVKAVDGVDLRLDRATVHGIIGPNGAGKSSLIDALSGRVRPSAGTVTLGGEDITRRSAVWRRRHGIARSFQRTSVFPGLTVEAQLRLAGGSQSTSDVDAIADQLGLRSLLGAVCGTIAYGDQRRVDLALALIGRPGVLLLDEPAAGLSAAETDTLVDHIKVLALDRQLTVLLVEHDVDAVFRCSDVVTVLHLGQVLTTGPPGEVRVDDRVVTAYLGERGVSLAPILELVGLRARYGQARILDGVDLSVATGEVVALIGRNGAGKTTTLLSLFGIPTVDGGTITIHGRQVRPRQPHEAARLGIAIAPQGRRILGNLTVEENLLLGAAAGRRGTWGLASVYELFPVLRERRDAPGTAMSGGQQQMLCIGRALMANPALLVLDEPCEGLAPVLIDELGEVLARVRAEGVAILIVEQHLDLVLRAADRFVVLAKGTTQAAGSLADLDIESLRSLLVV